MNAKTKKLPWEAYAESMAEFYSPEAQAKRLREEADRFDALARAARCDGDIGDEIQCQAKAAEARRKARRLEAGQ